MRGLVLEGGGAKGAYQAGAIKALNRKNVIFDGVVGTSIGSINAAFYVSGNLTGLYKLWLGTDSKYLLGIESDILSAVKNRNLTYDKLKAGIKTIGKIISTQGVDTKNIKTLLSNNINEENLRNSKVDFGLVTYNISDRKPVEIFKKDMEKGKLIDYLMASSYLPLFRYERIINEKYYIDGGFYSRCPIEMLMRNNYDEIYVIKAYTNKLRYKTKRGVKVHVITPRKNLCSIIDFYKDATGDAMNLGYYDTLKYLDKLDGKYYYFKPYDEKYYTSLFDKSTRTAMIKKYSNALLIKSNKDFIIRIVERVCQDLNINKFSVYNMPYLLTKLKYKIIPYKDNPYYDFIKKIKVNFK